MGSHGIGVCLQLVWVEVELGSSGVIGAREGEAAEHISIDILDARTMLNLEVELLDHEHPAGRFALEVGGGEEPLQGLMVGDEGEGGAVQVVAKAADGPHRGTKLTSVGGVGLFVLVEAAADACNHVLEVGLGVVLS